MKIKEWTNNEAIGLISIGLVLGIIFALICLACAGKVIIGQEQINEWCGEGYKYVYFDDDFMKPVCKELTMIETKDIINCSGEVCYTTKK